MPLPPKFKYLLELTYEQVERPSYVWLNYAVCGCEADSCGWQGWIVESAFVRREGEDDLLLPADDHLDGPNCRKPLFRTEVTYRFEPSEDQTHPLIPGVDYEETPMEYEGDPGHSGLTTGSRLVAPDRYAAVMRRA